MSPIDPSELHRSWCEIDPAALHDNISTLRALTSPDARLAPVVKSNAYGHGLLLAARVFLDAGADWLCVDALHEAALLRNAGIQAPIFVLGHVPAHHARTVAKLEVRLVVYDAALVDALSAAAQDIKGGLIPLHVKLETGTNRQGLRSNDAIELIQRIDRLPGVHLEGLSTHFANIEDTTDHTFAREQLARFQRFLQTLQAQRPNSQRLLHSLSNSAALILWPEAHHDIVRPGIAAYGMWPSRETFLSAMLAGRRSVTLKPALTWKTTIAQVRTVPTGEFVGYGCTFQATHPTRIAILPVGYYDGYVRALSNLAYVLIHGQRAPLRGRVCMNMMMVDVTDIPDVDIGDEVVLLGAQGEESLTASQLGEWSGTINYEVTTRIHPELPRRLKDHHG